MGKQQSKDELLYQQVIEGNSEAVKALHSNGASLEWVDKEGKTPLIVASMNPSGMNVTKALLELGANINVYRSGYHAGTVLHHAAKRGLDDTIQLLLSYGANPLVKNDACQTPLEVARAKGFSNVVRTIERRICIFSGWMKEFYGPEFLEALAPQLLSRKIWVVVVPCGLADPTKPLKLELVIYSSLKDPQPRNVIALWKASVKDLRFHQSIPVLTIFDSSNSNTRYRFTSVSDSEHKQLQQLHNACIGAIQVPTQNTYSTVPQSFAETSADVMELAAGIDSSIHSASGQSSRVSKTNDWSNTTDAAAHNGWSSLVREQPKRSSNVQGWMDGQTEVQESGWGSSSDISCQRQHSLSAQGSTSSELSCSGWNDEPAVEEYNGWGAPKPQNRHRDASTEVNYQGWGNTAKDTALPPIASSGGGTDNTAEAQEVNPAFSYAPPSAPPVPEEVFDEAAVHYPTVDVIPLQLSNPSPLTTENENKDESALCIVCWEAAIEGACVPCGHMVGCMHCLNQIKSDKGECPVCRVKIDQVIKLYSV